MVFTKATPSALKATCNLGLKGRVATIQVELVNGRKWVYGLKGFTPQAKDQLKTFIRSNQTKLVLR